MYRYNGSIHLSHSRQNVFVWMGWRAQLQPTCTDGSTPCRALTQLASVQQRRYGEQVQSATIKSKQVLRGLPQKVSWSARFDKCPGFLGVVRWAACVATYRDAVTIAAAWLVCVVAY